jgi:hypothetical protein
VQWDDVVKYVGELGRDDLLQLLIDVETLQGDDLALALANAVAAKDAPLIALKAARDAINAWARSDDEKLYAAEVDDILRTLKRSLCAFQAQASPARRSQHSSATAQAGP